MVRLNLAGANLVLVEDEEQAFLLPVDAGLHDLVHNNTAAGVEAVRLGDTEKAANAVGKLLWLFAKALARQRPNVAIAASGGLATIYATPEAEDHLRFDVAVGLSALGGLALRLQLWSFVRHLALLPSGRNMEARVQPYLIPDARLRAARSGLLSSDPDTPLIDIAKNWAREHAEARPEMPAEDDRVLNSICQFNALASLVHLGQGKDFAFPEFRRYESRRTDPVFESLVVSAEVARQIVPTADSHRLAALLIELGSIYNSYFVQFGAWGGFESRLVLNFLKANTTA